jgi:hypothetical protein
MTRINDELSAKKGKGLSGSGKWSEYRQPNTGTRVSWGGVDPLALASCVDAITSNGDALLLGSSRDGTVLVVTVCSGDERAKFYYRSSEEANGGLNYLADIAEQRSGRK